MYRSLHLKILVLVCLLLLSSCGAVNSKAGTPVSDEELNAAIEEANKTIDMLLRAMLAPKPSYDFLGIKIRFSTQDGGYDDNWVEPVDYYNGKFTIRMIDGLAFDKNLLLVVLTGPFLVSYIRARAEGLGWQCQVGLFTRAERVIVLALGLMMTRIWVHSVFVALCAMAVLVSVTVVQRLVYLWRQGEKPKVIK